MPINDDWWFTQPQYALVLTDILGNQYQIFTLASVQANLTTSSSQVGQAVITLYDPDWDIWRNVQPRAMWEVSLLLGNRQGEIGPPTLTTAGPSTQGPSIPSPSGVPTAGAMLPGTPSQVIAGSPLQPVWFGYIDEANKVDDPQTGQQIVLTCTSPVKIFEVKNQTPSEAASLIVAYASGVVGSAVLVYAAQKAGFPASKLRIDPNADVGANTWGAVSAGDMMNPQQSSWSAVLQGLLADSGLEMFFDEEGNLIWRPLAYLATNPSPRVINLADVGHYDIGYGDQGVVTTVEVRYGQTPFHVPPAALGPSSYWNAPPEMVAGLKGVRYYTVTAPYISSNQYGAATYLAKALGQMSSANVSTGTIIQVCDPFFKIGRVYEIPSNDPREGSALGYLSSIALNLQWKGPWIEVLGFTYLRPKGQSFPYGLNPTPLVPPAGSAPGILKGASTAVGSINPLTGKTVLIPNINLDATYAQNNTGRLKSSFNLVQDSSIADGNMDIDPKFGINVGAKIQIWSSFTGPNKVAIGTVAVYTVTATDVSDGAAHISNTGGHTTGYFVQVQAGDASNNTTSSPTSTPSGGGGTPPNPTPVPDPGNMDGSNQLTPQGYFPRFPMLGYTMAGMISAGQVTQEFGPTSYEAFHTGLDFGAPGGTPTVSSISGKVTSVGWYQSVSAKASDGTNPSGQPNLVFGSPQYPGFGYNVSIRSGDITIHYGHQVDGSSTLSPGQQVNAGDRVGLEGSTGNSSGNHLHFGVFDHSKGVWVNPHIYLGGLPANATLSGGNVYGA